MNMRKIEKKEGGGILDEETPKKVEEDGKGNLGGVLEDGEFIFNEERILPP